MMFNHVYSAKYPNRCVHVQEKELIDKEIVFASFEKMLQRRYTVTLGSDCNQDI